MMDWSHIEDIHSAALTSNDNPFAIPKVQAPRKVSIWMPADDWLYKKLSKLNLTWFAGYPYRIPEAGGLLMNQFI